MNARLNIAFFGSSLLSSYWNGAATYYRGIIRALHRRGHRVTFYEPDAFDRQNHRDIEEPDWARVVVYPGDEAGARRALQQARGADVVVKASGIGANDALLEREVLSVQSASTAVVFWDVDAPATLERLQAGPHDAFRALIPAYDFVLTYGGGPRVVAAYRAFGARECVPVYNALDPDTHHPVPPQSRFAADLSFLGNRLPDREARVDQFFFEAARRLPERTFLLGGAGWDHVPANVRALGHVATADHNAFNCSARLVLNINRDSMARFGWSPPTRVFEAAGAGACVGVDEWDGIEHFLEPDSEVLVARDGEDVAHYVKTIGESQARRIGERGRARLLSEHTYARRAELVERVLTGRHARMERVA
ncbi:MAG TPA: glycosyltransferase [Rhodanobacteraceae bacterium]|nr:glycosyltransferase [Rhodanobacteraceae bacterium]